MCILEAYSEPCQRSKMEHFAKHAEVWLSNFIEIHTFTCFVKRSILDVWQGSEYTSVFLKHTYLRKYIFA